MLEEAGKLAEGTAHHQAEHREIHVDVPVPYPLPSIPVLQLEQKAAFHTNKDKLSLTKGHSWDSTK